MLIFRAWATCGTSIQKVRFDFYRENFGMTDWKNIIDSYKSVYPTETCRAMVNWRKIWERPFLYWGRIIRLDEVGQWFGSSSGLCVSGIKTSTRRIMRPDELPFVVRRSRRSPRETSSRRIMRVVPVFILETHNQTSYKCLPKFVQTDNASLV